MTRAAVRKAPAARGAGRAPVLGGLAGAVVGMLALVGCAEPLPVPEPDPVPAVPPPVLEEAQWDAVLDDLGATLRAADDDLDAERLERRVTGPALVIRTAEYTVSQALEDPEDLIELPVDSRPIVVIPTTDTWPRTFLVVTEQPEDLQSPRLLVLRQEAPRAPYLLWGWSRLLPGVDTPAALVPEVGSDPVELDAELLARPGDVPEHFVDVLTEGEGSEYADDFAPDAFRERLDAAREQLEDIAEQTGGELTEEHEVDPDHVVALATVEGGAFVVAQLTTTTTLTTDGRTLRLPDADAVLLGSDTVDEQAVFTWTGVIVFHVPANGSDDPLELIAAEYYRTDVSGE